MKTIVINPSICDHPEYPAFFRKVLERNGYLTPAPELPLSILREQNLETMMLFAIKDLEINESFVFYMEVIDKEIRGIKRGKYDIDLVHEDVQNSVDSPMPDEEFDILFSPQNVKVYKRNELFFYPLTEMDKETTNLYGFVSNQINLMRYYDSTWEEKKEAELFLSKILLENYPEISATTLIENAKAGKTQALMELCIKVVQAMENFLDKEFNR